MTSPPLSRDFIPEDDALLAIRKPRDWSSFDVIKKVRNILRVRKAGHAGTLDPIATGVLIIATGRKTRELNRFQDLEKEYNVVVVLGGRTSSHDSETEITEHYSLDGITKELIHKTAAEFVGIQYQIPPMYSAVKVGGRRLYKFARKGVEIPRPQREIRIFSLAVTDVVMPRVHLNVVCSKGTYIRTLVDDLGKRLGCGAFVESLERARIGTVGLDDAWTLDDLQRYVENHQPAAWKS